METQINIAEILKGCPKGMELDCPMYKNVTLLEVADCDLYPIRIKTKSGFISELTKFGQNIHNDDAKCVIFPKGKTTWEGFVPPFSFNDGDIVATDDGWIGITTGGKIGEFIPTHCVIKHFDEFEAYLDRKETWMFHRLATEEEKKKLFDAIKEHGYKWDEETNTLDKLPKPKFKVGDSIIKRNSIVNSWIVSSVGSEYYGLKTRNNSECIGVMSIAEQDEYELVPDKFDINTLVPFESRVLMRSSNAREWVGTIYSHYSNNKFYGCGMCCDQCIPYEGNQHLLGTTNDCDEYYKTW